MFLNLLEQHKNDTRKLKNKNTTYMQKLMINLKKSTNLREKLTQASLSIIGAHNRKNREKLQIGTTHPR